MPRRTISHILEDPFAACDHLTPAERNVANRVAKGWTISQVASVARVSQNAVRLRLRSAMLKMGCKHKWELTSLLIKELTERVS